MDDHIFSLASSLHLIKIAIAFVVCWIAGSLVACATPGGYVVGWDNIHQIAKERRQLELEHSGAPMDAYDAQERLALERGVRNGR